ncbi:hypothetical protein Egran_00046 [Elaphomyces granulatus]|uniref:Hydrophobin n=1 Tax=Elaphomyces granulatus TaxID=519963 RepID=A0A232M751_9EURO|nr:hypothetical protein Egran_00046 [Elaphomyces granulatus]
MQFNTINALWLFSALLAGGMASPIGETSLEDRGHPKFGCPPVSSVTQINQCSSGTPFCCSPTDSGGHNCVKSQVSCDQTVICCNNNGGTQICIGGTNINIDMPITINL